MITLPQYLANPGYSIIVRDEVVKWSGDRKVVLKPALCIQFGELGTSTFAADDTGTPRGQEGGFGSSRILVADYSSGLLDTDEYAESHHLDAEDKKLLEEVLEYSATNKHAPAFGDITKYEAPKPRAPWSTYDNQTPAQIVKLAEEVGLVSEAYQYEALTKNRKSVMDELRALLTQEEELTAA